MRACAVQILLLLLCAVPLPAGGPPVRYGIALSPTPVLNSKDFHKGVGNHGLRLKTDSCGQTRELEFVALTGTIFVIHDSENEAGILKVTTDDYPYAPAKGLFIDSRLVSITDKPPPRRSRHLPRQDELIRKLRALEGTPYVWGGNVSGGVDGWGLAGVDCSGLLYEVTDGWTPRNTSSLGTFGDQVAIAGLSASALAAILRPLDLIVWPGHVLIMLDNGEIIESRLSCDGGRSGVIIEPAVSRLQKILKSRRPVNSLSGRRSTDNAFVVRRWLPQGN